MSAEHMHHDPTSTRQQYTYVGSFDSIQLDQLSLQEVMPQMSSCRNLSHSPSKRYKSGEFSPTLLDKDAAKAAAEYYGDCFTQGVDFESAEYIAKQAHDVYKKHWLQDSSLDYPMVTSVGDSFAVPRYGPLNTPIHENGSPNASKGVHNLHRQENKVIDPRIISNYYTVNDYEYTGPSMPKNIGGSAKETASVTLRDEMKRLEYDNELFFRSHNFPRATQITTSPVDANDRLRNDNISFTLEERSKRKRQLELLTDVEGPVLNCSQSSFSTAETEWHSNVKGNDRVYTRDYSFNTENKTELHLEHMAAFEREKIKRKQIERRGSSYQDYWEDGLLSDNDSQSDIKEDYNECSQHHYLGCDDMKLTAILTSPSPPPPTGVAKTIDGAKSALIIALTVSSGDVTSKSFLSALEQLRSLYRNTGWDARDYNRQNANSTSKYIEGNWLTLSRPNYAECLGTNANNEFMYTLGRMSFDMFSPGNLVCSIGGVFNSIDVVDIHKGVSSLKSIPKSLKNDVLKNDNCLLRRYDIITTFNIEPYSPLFGSNSPNKAIHKPIRGSITTYGYVLPDPEVPNRLSIWFSGGRIEANVEDRDGLDQWKKAFSVGTSKRPWQDKARVIAAKLLLGANIPDHMNEDGSMEFDLARPIGGHGSTYVDVLYLDESLRIVQGHKGSIFVMTRVSK